MTTNTYTFGTPSSYTYDSDLIEISSNTCKFAFEEDSEDYTQTFDSDTGFTYDNTKSEFTGGLVRQKDQRPSNATFGATYSTNINGNWGGGTLTGTPTGSPVISGGKLVMITAGGGDHVNYASSGNVNGLIQTGTIRFMLTPNFTTSPAADLGYFFLSQLQNNANNLIQMTHSNGSGNATLFIYNSSGTSVVTQNYALSLVSGVECEIEIDFNLTTGATRLFKNGTQVGATNTSTGTRSSTIGAFGIGTSYDGRRSNFSIRKFFVTPDVLHTSNYTPGYTLTETAYLETNVTLPPFEHTGDGTIIAANSFTVDEVGSPKYSVDVRPGTELFGWWNPSTETWENSDGSYTQSSTEAEFNLHMVEDPVVYGAIYACFKIHFPASNTLSSVNTLTINVTEQIYSTANPRVYFNTPISCTDVSAIAASVTAPSGTALKLTINRNGTEYYYDGAAWSASSGYAQSNTFAELTESVLDSLASGTRKNINPVLYLHSDDGKSTPTITNYSLTYDYAIPDPTLPNIVDVEGFVYDSKTEPVASLDILVRPYEAGYFNNGVFVLYEWEKIGTTDIDGYFHGPVFLQTSGKYWSFKIGKQSYKIELTNVSDMNLKDALTFTLIEE